MNLRKKKKKRIIRYEKEIAKYKEIIENLQIENKYNDYLKEENKKMIDWCFKILNEFNTFDVRTRERITIPIMKQEVSYNIDENFKVNTETIIIPEIVLQKSIYERDKNERN